ncbi:MAG: helix-turn-helix domain-containing protein [Streptosporangiaceae bacterium]
MADVLLDRAEAAERLHVSQMTVRRLGREGFLDEIRVSKRAVRITLESVDRHLASRRIAHSSGGASAA